MDEQIIEQPDEPYVIKPLTERVDILQREIVDLQEQIRDLQNRLSHYMNLLRHYRVVIEAESLGLGYKPSAEIMDEGVAPVNPQSEARQSRKLTVAKAVREVMAARQGETLSQSRVYELVHENYPDLRGRGGNEIMSAVAHALIRGVYNGRWKRIKPGMYQNIK